MVDVPLLLYYYESKLSLILTISQDRAGATQIMNAGLFQAVRASGLFTADPDLGIEMDNSDALNKYYELLLYVVRVITAVVVSRGTDNAQTIEQARYFLEENRPSIVAIFKRQAKIGGVPMGRPSLWLDELVELTVLLMTMTEFLSVRSAPND